MHRSPANLDRQPDTMAEADLNVCYSEKFEVRGARFAIEPSLQVTASILQGGIGKKTESHWRQLLSLGPETGVAEAWSQRSLALER